MAAEARRETRQGAEGNEEGDGGDGAQDSERVGFIIIIRPPLLTTNKVSYLTMSARPKGSHQPMLDLVGKLGLPSNYL